MTEQPDTEQLVAELRATIAKGSAPSANKPEIPSFSPEATGETPAAARAAAGNTGTSGNEPRQGQQPPLMPTQTSNPYWSNPAIAQPNASKPQVRTGLLVWSAVLLLCGLWILLRLFMPALSGTIVSAGLLATFGVIFLIGAISSATKNKS